MFTRRSSPALAWAPQVRVRKRTAQVHQIPGRPIVPPARPIGRRGRGRKAPCTPLGAPWRLRTRKVPIFLLLLCSTNVCVRLVQFSSAKHHFGADITPFHFLQFPTLSFFRWCQPSLCFSHPTAISLVLKQLTVNSWIHFDNVNSLLRVPNANKCFKILSSYTMRLRCSCISIVVNKKL